MTKALHLDERFGLHERAISASLKLMHDDSKKPPSLERIAAEMRVEPEELRNSFNSGSDILNAAAEQALVRLVDRVTKATISLDLDNYIGQIYALGHAYLEWSAEHPHHFRLITDSQLVDMNANPNLNRYRKSLIDVMNQILGRAQETGALHPSENVAILAETSRTFAQCLARKVVNAAEGKATEAELKSAKLTYTDYIKRAARGASNTK